MPDKYVCAECISDYAIKEFIEQNALNKKCSYCSREFDEPIAAPLEEVVDFIREGLETEWDNPRLPKKSPFVRYKNGMLKNLNIKRG